MDVIITFDDRKREANRAKHGLDFGDLTAAFFDGAAVSEAKGDRLRAIGWLGDEIIIVIFRPLGTEALSVISMRPASRKERRVLQ